MFDQPCGDILPGQCQEGIVPFRAEFSCDLAAWRTSQGSLAQDVEGSGDSAVLGRFRIKQRHRLNLAVGEIRDGRYTLVTANEDRLFGRYIASLDYVSVNLGVLRGRGHWTVAGGSGRFAGARCGGIATISCPAGGSCTTVLEGVIEVSERNEAPQEDDCAPLAIETIGRADGFSARLNRL